VTPRGAILAVWLAALGGPALAQAAALLVPPRAAVEPDGAYGAFQRGLYLTALREATARLDRNPDDAAAMTLIGELNNLGLGIRPDPAKAAEWYRLAARRGDPHALASLGLMALDGRGMEKNPQQGRAWFEEAAAKGEPSASHNLALLLLSTGAPGDLARAVQLLRVAADAEIADAQHALGVLHLRGRGVPREAREAANWFRRAADNGNRPARSSMRSCCSTARRASRRTKSLPRVISGAQPPRATPSRRIGSPGSMSPAGASPGTRSRPPPGISWRLARASRTPGSTRR
jgi:TPR repeat protein